MLKRLTVLFALILLFATIAPAAFADDPDTGDVGDEMTAYSAMQIWKAQMIADYFASLAAPDVEEGESSEADAGSPEITEDAVLALRTGETLGHPVGWGALFQLLRYVGGDLLGEEFALNGGLAIGHHRKDFLDDPDNGDEPGAKNLGQLMKDQKAAPGWMPPGQAKKHTTDG
jgi:hypothetical protein